MVGVVVQFAGALSARWNGNDRSQSSPARKWTRGNLPVWLLSFVNMTELRDAQVTGITLFLCMSVSVFSE